MERSEIRGRGRPRIALRSMRATVPSQNETHRPHRTELVRVEDRAPLGELQHAADAAQLVAIMADELAHRLAAAIAVDDEEQRVGGRPPSIVSPPRIDPPTLRPKLAVIQIDS